MKKLEPLKMQSDATTKKAERDYWRGIELIESYVQNHEMTSVIKREYAFLLYHYGVAREHFGAPSEAQELYEQALSLCEEIIQHYSDVEGNLFINASMMKAQIQALLGRKEEATQTALQTYQTRPNFATAQRVAVIYSSIGECTEALRWLEKAYTYAPEEQKSFKEAEQAILFRESGDVAKAEEYAERAMKNLPKTPAGENMRKMLQGLSHSEG